MIFVIWYRVPKSFDLQLEMRNFYPPLPGHCRTAIVPGWASHSGINKTQKNTVSKAKMLTTCIVALFAIASTVFAAASQKKTFVVPHTEGADDAVAVRAALSNFSSDSIILFEKGKTYNIWTPINFGTLTNVEIAIEGNITLPESIPEVQGKPHSWTYGLVQLTPFSHRRKFGQY